jgi:outer membrane immunogenic protein
MRKVLLGNVALMALSTASAFAADLPGRPYTKAPAHVPAPVYNWTGVYVGGHIGGAFETSNIGGLATSGDRSSVFGGVQIGYDYQFMPNWVVGIEGQYSALDLSRSGTLGAVSAFDKTRGFGSVTGRIGYTWGPGLLYFKGGAGFRAPDDLNATIGGVRVPDTVSRQDSGYTVGGGFEYLFAPSWSAKVEYQYLYIIGDNFTVPTVPAIAVNVNNFIHTVKLGVNYRFNLDAPIFAKN